LATEVTLQPISRFDFDAAILFSDILVTPHVLGQSVEFKEGIGPTLSPLDLGRYQKHLSLEGFEKRARPVYETVRQIRTKLPSSKPLIGFAGAPWTLALYMLEGQGSRDFAQAKEAAFRNEEAFTNLLGFLAQAASQHLLEQVKAGAQVIQLFDTWAGLCPATHFLPWVVAPTQQIVSILKKEVPEVPILGFPKGVGRSLLAYERETDLDGLSLDASTPLPWAAENLSKSLVLQGNLDPVLLVAGGEPLQRAIHQIHKDMQGRPYIFNLGHGILPQTPLENVAMCVKTVRALS
jgi:uroporphyrinogen decarboxylase